MRRQTIWAREILRGESISLRSQGFRVHRLGYCHDCPDVKVEISVSRFAGLGKEKAPAIAEARGLFARLKLERYRTRDRGPHRL